MRSTLGKLLVVGGTLTLALGPRVEPPSPGPPRPPSDSQGALARPIPAVPAPRPSRFYTDMPMDIVRIITPEQPAAGPLPPMPRDSVRIIAPNAAYREYESQMPIFGGGPLPQPRPSRPAPPRVPPGPRPRPR